VRVRSLLHVVFALLVVSSGMVQGQEAFPGAEFTRVGDMVVPVIDAGFAVADPTPESNVAVLFGGGATTIPNHWSAVIRTFDMATQTAQVAGVSLPYTYYNNESYGAARASNGKYYVGPGNGFGGWGTHQRIIEVDLVANTAVERAPIIGSNIWGVAVASAPASRGGVYTLGGWNGGGLSHVMHYDPVLNVMTLKGFLSVPRTVGSRVTHPNGRVYVFGGNVPGTHHAVDVLDMVTEQVRAVPNPFGFTFDHSTRGWVGPDGAIYLWNPIAAHHGPSSSGRIIRFDPVTETFTNLGVPPGDGIHAGPIVRDASSARVYSFSIWLAGYIWGVRGALASGIWTFSTAPVDEEPPVLSLPADITAEATTSCSAPVTWEATALDDVDGVLPVTCSRASGTSFDTGVTTVTCSAEDASGNSSTGAFTVTVVDGAAPTLTVPPDISVAADPMSCSAIVSDLGSAVAQDNCAVDVTVSGETPDDRYPVGITIITYTATDDAGHSVSATQRIIVNDVAAPSITGAAASPSVLWPPNHKMVDVHVSYATSDACGQTTARIVEIRSSEATNGVGDGDSEVDFEIVSPTLVRLRAERSGTNGGRTYTIVLRVTDGDGNTSTQELTVLVPHAKP
jgi:hypothetical protein